MPTLRSPNHCITANRNTSSATNVTTHLPPLLNLKANNKAFIVMEYLEEATLKHLIQDKPLPLEQMADLDQRL